LLVEGCHNYKKETGKQMGSGTLTRVWACIVKRLRGGGGNNGGQQST
jgi:hypothetical protein